MAKVQAIVLRDGIHVDGVAYRAGDEVDINADELAKVLALGEPERLRKLTKAKRAEE